MPDAILLKRGVLRHGEWGIMKTHCHHGAQLIGGGNLPYLRMGAEIALHHHERWDRSGYSAGLKGQVIPISARIMNICDQYDVLRSERPHKRSLSHAAAVEIITVGNTRTTPSQLDPDVLRAFQRCSGAFRDIFASISDQHGL